MLMKKRAHVYYSGHVQGVGFRYTTRRIAGQLGLSGWVRNLPDGQVEMVAEADEETMRKALEAIKNAFQEYIEDAKISWRDATEEFSGFDIVF